MAKYIRLGIRAEICGDDSFAPADFIMKSAEELSGYENIVYLPEQTTPVFPATVTLADISGWASADLLIVLNTGSTRLSLFYTNSTGPVEEQVQPGMIFVSGDFDTSATISIQGVSGVAAATFMALLAGK